MFYSLQDVHDGFFKLFQPQVVVPLGSATFPIPVVYARKSNKANDKKPLEGYPRIVLLDQTISFSKDWRPNEESFVVGYELNNTTNLFDKAWVTKAPLELLFSYQVSGYFDNLQHKLAFMTWVFENFRAFGGVMLNPEVLPDGHIIGDSTTYSMGTNELDRADGIFEYNLSFVLKPLVHLEKVELLDLVNRFSINGLNSNPPVTAPIGPPTPLPDVLNLRDLEMRVDELEDDNEDNWNYNEW